MFDTRNAQALYDLVAERAADLITEDRGDHARMMCLMDGHSSIDPAFMSVHNGEFAYRCAADGHDPDTLAQKLSAHTGIPYVYLSGLVTFDPTQVGETPADRKTPERVIAAKPVPQERGELVATYQYRDTDGVTRYTKRRYRRADGTKTFAVYPRLAEHPEIPRVLYNTDLITAAPECPVWIVEGEKDADNLNAALDAGGVATTTYDGSGGKWIDDYTITLAGHPVIVIPDNDTAGETHLRKVVDALSNLVPSITVKRVPKELGKDVSDLLDAGGTLDDLITDDRDQRNPLGFSDAEIADKIADKLRPEFRYTQAEGWHRYNGVTWSQVSDHRVREHVRVTVLNTVADIAKRSIADPNLVPEFKGWQTLLPDGKRRTAVDACAGILEVDIAEFDADPWVLNTPGGLVDLRTGEVEPHAAEHLCTKVTAGSYRPGHTHPAWDTALTSLPEQSREWMKYRFGQAATGVTTSDDLMVILQGRGENGKTTLLDAVASSLGTYAHMGADSLFMSAKNSNVANDLADLRGARLVFVEEITEGRSIDVGRLKKLIGTGKMRGKRLYHEPFEFSPSHTVFATTNYEPVVAETDHGTWRRLRMVRFPYRFVKPGEHIERGTDRQGDPAVRDQVAPTGGRAQSADVADAIVTWIVEGTLGSADPDNMRTPEEVRDSTREWRRSADRILGFWDSGIIERADGWVVPADDLLREFNEWNKDLGAHSGWRMETFAERFAGHDESAGVEKRRVRSKAYQVSSRVPGMLKDQIQAFTGIRFT